MADFTPIGIFWLSFAAFIGPIFIIALICSIVKAIRFRKDFNKRRDSMNNEERLFDEQGPVDAEIITTPNARRKPNFQLVEDEDRRKQFRNNQGLLSIPEPSTKKIWRDTAVDAEVAGTIPNNENGNNVNASNTCESHRVHVMMPSTKNAKSTNDHSKAKKKYKNSRHKVKVDVGTNTAAGDYDFDNGDCNNKHTENGGPISYNNNALNSDVHDSNGHIIPSTISGVEQSIQAIGSSPKSRKRLDQNQGLRPDSYTNSPRRHSVNTSSPTSYRREKKSDSVEMNTCRSKSEENLMDHSNQNLSSSYLQPGDRGMDNQGFARSTETTIM